MERIDQTHPFGTDSTKNNKYAENLVGEDYGMNTFWGKPNSKDTVKKMIDKVQWLSTSYTREVFWRKTVFFACLLMFLILIVIDYTLILKPDKIVSVLSLCYIAIYMYRSYDNAHLRKIQCKFINQNIRKIKRKLNIKVGNFIDDLKVL
jgi:hypothetical protein